MCLLARLDELKENDIRKMCCRTAATKNAKNEENKMLKQLVHRPLLKPQQRTQRF